MFCPKYLNTMQRFAISKVKICNSVAKRGVGGPTPPSKFSKVKVAVEELLMPEDVQGPRTNYLPYMLQLRLQFRSREK